MQDESILQKINEEVLCILKRNNANLIEVNFVDIINPIATKMDHLISLCNNPESNIREILDYIKKNEDFEQLSDKYSFCLSLSSPYQSFTVNNSEFLNEIEQKHKELNLMAIDNPKTFNLNESIDNS